MRWTFRTILTVIVVTAAAACGGKSAQAPGEPRFTSVRLTDTRESTEEKTVFAGDTPKVYAIFTIAAVPAGTTIKSVWIAEKTDVAPADHKIDEATLTMGDNVTSGTFSFSRPTNGWPAGSYRVELYIGERLGHTARFQVEAAASAPLASPAAASPAPATPGATVPFASKGWAFENSVYVNARHGLRVEVPAGWTIGNEQRYSDRILWVMSRLDAAGRERLGANISHIGVGQTSPEEFARNELEALKQVTYESGGERKALFSVTASGKIRDDLFNLEYVRNDNRSKGGNLHFTRNGFGYVISLKWAGDATQEELAELGAVARSMGYPELSFTQAAPAVTATSSGAAGPATATIGDIVFATDLQSRRPVGAATSFPQGTRRIYAFFPWKNLRPDDAVEGTWFKDGEQVLKRSTSVAEVLGRNLAPTGNLWFWVNWGNGAPAGSYHFEVWVNGQLARRGTFDVKPQ